ncbi:MAG: ACT domain-containing protein [Ignavibacteriales bacterium]|nr:ACT domain-containing protein [Ignavibacteriales bacterium]
MTVKQLSIFLENKSGRLAEVTKTLGDAGVNMSAFSLADTADFGVLRVIVDDPEKAATVLRDSGRSVKLTDVVCVRAPHRPGGLADALAALNEAGVVVEYLYAFVAEKDAIVVIRTEENDRAVEALRAREFQLVSPDEVYRN